MANAKKLPSGNWRVRAGYTDANGEHRTKSFTAESKRAAELAASLWLSEEKENVQNAIKLTPRKAIEIYAETALMTGGSPASQRTYKNILRNIFQLLMDRPIEKLTLQDVQKEVNVLSERVCAQTVRNYYAVFSAALRQTDQCRFDLGKVRLPRLTEPKEIQIPTMEEVSGLLDSVYQDDDLYTSVMLAALMGLRKEEICAASWNDISYGKNGYQLHVHLARVKNADGMEVIKGTKTKAGDRFLPIPEPVYKELFKRRRVDGRLVGLTLSALSGRFLRASKAAGMTCRFHDLRHFHASMMLAAGAPEKYICADMGHSSYNMIRRVYGHVMGYKQREIDSVMDEKIRSILK